MNYIFKTHSQQNSCTKQTLKNLMKKHRVDDEDDVLDEQSYDDIVDLVTSAAFLLELVGLKMVIQPDRRPK